MAWGTARKRFIAEVCAGVATAVATVLTLLVPEWIEVVFAVDPDHGDGSLEWMIAAGFGLATVALAALSWLDRPRSLRA
jgi:multisubunit Na+/H+ antiporter MnhB subunit